MLAVNNTHSTSVIPPQPQGLENQDSNSIKSNVTSAGNSSESFSTAANSPPTNNTNSLSITIPKQIHRTPLKERRTIKAKQILTLTRALFKGSPYKSDNKITSRTTLEEWSAKINTINKVRTSGTLEKQLEHAIASKSGNCGEMACLAYIFWYQIGLWPEMIEYDPTKGTFDHQACVIKIGTEDFVIAPWANILCRLEEHIDALANKVKQWESQEKHIVTRFFYAMSQDNIPGKEFMQRYATTEEHIRHLRLTARYEHKELERLANSDFFLQITKDLEQNPTRQLEI